MSAWVQASFRDPEGQVFVLPNSVVRKVQPEAAHRLTTFFGAEIGQRLSSEQCLVPTRPLTEVQARDLGLPKESKAESRFFEHDKIGFASFPHEWPPALLYEAGQLTLRLANRLLESGYGLKDASAYNVMFHCGQPVFIDVLSIEDWDARLTTWRPYGQFVQNFILPLLVWRNQGIAPHLAFFSNRNGFEPKEVYKLSSMLGRFCPPVLGLASIPTWLEIMIRGRNGEERSFSAPRARSDEQARFIIAQILKGLLRSLNKVRPTAHESHWSGYERSNTYDGPSMREKEQFVADVFAGHKSATVLDVGCNTGAFTCMAARQGAAVVAIDSDTSVLDHLWQTASRERLDVLPLVLNICRPTPALGWRNGESSAFLERAKERFDMVLMLAVIHHMLVTERIPLEEIIRLAAEMSASQAILEYVSPADPQFIRIARGNDLLYRTFTVDRFEAAVQQRFSIRRAQTVGPHRKLYHLQKI
jgi:SAM-dependent methyltransferase